MRRWGSAGGGSQAEGGQVIEGVAIGLGLARGKEDQHGMADEFDLGPEDRARGLSTNRESAGSWAKYRR
jgi:hypothetical protein